MSALTPQQKERQAIADLIVDLRGCTLCVIVPGVSAALCAPHQERLDALMPERCNDPGCYGCSGGAR